MICVYSALYTPLTPLPFSIAPSPPHQTSTLKRCPSSKNLSAVFKIRLGTFGNPLRGLDMHQIEVGFLYLLRGRMKRGEVFKRESSSLYQHPAQPPSRHPHPLVTERGGDAVNYRRAPHYEQWFIHFSTLHPPQHLHSTTDTNSSFQKRKSNGDTLEDLWLTLCNHILDQH